MRTYATTADETFAELYHSNTTANETDWANLKSNRSLLNPEQVALLDNLASARERFIRLPPQLFAEVQGERMFEDLYLFRTQAEPRAEVMLTLLENMTADQQTILQTDLNTGRDELTQSQIQTIAGGIVALLVGIGLSILFRANIIGPIRRLTDTAEQITAGNLNAQAEIEAQDEIGTLAATTNMMTTRLRQTIANIQALNESYARFVPHQFLSFLEKESILDVQLGDQVQAEMTVLFSDIRHFTDLSEKMTPEENFAFVNEYLGRMEPILIEYNGFIDKYIGGCHYGPFCYPCR